MLRPLLIAVFGDNTWQDEKLPTHPTPGIVLLSFVFTFDAWAGGSGFNVVVVVNQNSTNSVQLGNYYLQQRNVPPQNLLRINWTGSSIEWALTDFNSILLNSVSCHAFQPPVDQSD